MKAQNKKETKIIDKINNYITSFFKWYIYSMARTLFSNNCCGGICTSKNKSSTG